jgi:hypothetical protein
MRVRGANRRQKHKKILLEKKFMPRKEQDEPDAEPRGRDLRRSMSDVSGKSRRQSSHPVIPLKALMRKHLVASIDDEPEHEDCTGAAYPGCQGFVAEQTAEVERVMEIFRMDTEGQVRLVDEERLEQLDRERKVVPDGIVHSCAEGLEHKTAEPAQ